MAISTNKEVQHALNLLGANPPLAEDGSLGPLSKGIVTTFQRDHGLTVDGIAGPQTKAALQAAIDLQAAGTPATPNTPAATDATWDPNAIAATVASAIAAGPAPRVTAIHVPAAPPTSIAPAPKPVTLHVDSVTGKTTVKPFGTPAPKTAAPSVPWTTAEKAGVGAAIAGLVVAGYFGMKK